MPRPPKPPELRQRRNKATTRAKLRAGTGGMRAPELPLRACPCGGPPPERKRRKGPGRPPKPRPPCEACADTGVLLWHPETRATWAIWWASPGAAEWIEADLPGLRRLIEMIEDYHRALSSAGRLELQKEIRLQEARFGIFSPLDRRRVEWSIERPEEETPTGPAPDEPPQKPVVDPRSTIRLVG